MEHEKKINCIKPNSTLNLNGPNGGSAYGIPVNPANNFPSLDAAYLPLMRPSLTFTINSLSAQELSKSNVVNPIISHEYLILNDFQAISQAEFVEMIPISMVYGLPCLINCRRQSLVGIFYILYYNYTSGHT